MGSDVIIVPGAGPLELVLADDGGTVEGQVTADEGPAPAWILLAKDGVPSRNASSDPAGHFKIDNLPPGDYRIYAWDDNSTVEYANPEWLRQHGKGLAVTVAAGQTIQVKVTRQIAPPDQGN